jgi:outer membrane murein-binding lipoprotein Lpp
MNTFQKILLGGLFVALGICVYQATVVARLRTEIQALRQQQGNLNGQVSELTASLEMAKGTAARASEENERLTGQLRRVAKQSASQRQTPSENPKPAGLASLFGGEGTNGMFGGMSKMMDVFMNQRVDSKMAALKGRLNLSPEQEASIREILAKQSKAGTEMAQQMFSGNGIKTNVLSQVGAMAKDDQIKALLSPEQATAYDAVEKEEQGANVRLMANAELLQLQSTLQLSEDQQDKVFTVLAEQAQAQFLDAPTNGANLDLPGMFQRKADALRGVLTPDQFERYQKFQQQQLDMMQAITGAVGKQGGP